MSNLSALKGIWLEYEGSAAGEVGVESIANESPSKRLNVTLFLILLV